MSTVHPRPKTSEVRALSAVRCAVVASPFDPGFDGRKTISLRAYQPAQNNRIINVPVNTLIYLPRHGGDWLDHPKALRAQLLLVWSVVGNSYKEIQMLRTGKVFFIIPNSWGGALIQGKKLELDLLAELEAGLPDY